jgi:hypothetical protein
LLARGTVTFTTRVSSNTFASLVCELVTSKNQIKRVKSTPTFQLVVASVSNNNASSFDDKSSSTFQLVVASVDWKSKAISNQTIQNLMSRQNQKQNVIHLSVDCWIQASASEETAAIFG